MESTNPFEQPSEPSLQGASLELGAVSDRMVASFVDNLFVFGPGFVGGFLVGVVCSMAGLKSEDYEAVWTPPLGILILCTFIYQWYWIAIDGTTFGKRQLRLRVVHDNGEPVGFFFGVVLRQWVLGVPRLLFGCFGVALVLLDLAFVVGERRKCLHDWLAGTVVVRDRRPPRPRPTARG